MAVAAVAIRSAFPTTAAAAAAPPLRPAFLGVARAAASSRRRRILLPAWPVAAMSSSSSSSAAAAHKAGAWYAVPDLSLRDHRFAVPLDHSSPPRPPPPSPSSPARSSPVSLASPRSRAMRVRARLYYPSSCGVHIPSHRGIDRWAREGAVTIEDKRILSINLRSVQLLWSDWWISWYRDHCIFAGSRLGCICSLGGRRMLDTCTLHWSNHQLRLLINASSWRELAYCDI